MAEKLSSWITEEDLMEIKVHKKLYFNQSSL